MGTPPAVSLSGLPDKLRLSTVFESLEYAMRGPRYGASSGREARFAGVVAAAKRIVGDNIDPRALSLTKGNPDSGRVHDMFAALGVRNPFDETRAAFDLIWAKPESSSFVRDKLDEIVNARHVVAHTASALAVSRGNLQEWPRFLRAVAKVLDDRLDQYVANVRSGAASP